jgi:Protein of unknown function (DUF3618)
VAKAAPPAHRNAIEPRSQQQIQDDLESSRVRLASTIDQLTYRVHPKTIVKRKLDDIRAHFVDADGALRKDKIALVAGAAVGFIALSVAVRIARRHKG